MLDIAHEAQRLNENIAHAVLQLREGGVVPKLVDVVATHDDAVRSYIRTKRGLAERVRVNYEVMEFDQSATTNQIIEAVSKLNQDRSVTGIMISTPMFQHLMPECIIAAVDPQKDVDGLTPINVAHLACNEEHLAILPATALAALHILELCTSAQGKHVVVLGRGRTVGRPAAQMAVNRHATVTICHSQTRHLEHHTTRADIIISAIGRPELIDERHVREGQFVIDCGISVRGGKVVGDVAYSKVAPIAAYVTPVPGGVGVLTRSFLFTNLLKATALQHPGDNVHD